MFWDPVCGLGAVGVPVGGSQLGPRNQLWHVRGWAPFSLRPLDGEAPRGHVAPAARVLRLVPGEALLRVSPGHPPRAPPLPRAALRGRSPAVLRPRGHIVRVEEGMPGTVRGCGVAGREPSALRAPVYCVHAAVRTRGAVRAHVSSPCALILPCA